MPGASGIALPVVGSDRCSEEGPNSYGCGLDTWSLGVLIRPDLDPALAIDRSQPLWRGAHRPAGPAGCRISAATTTHRYDRLVCGQRHRLIRPEGLAPSVPPAWPVGCRAGVTGR